KAALSTLPPCFWIIAAAVWETTRSAKLGLSVSVDADADMMELAVSGIDNESPVPEVSPRRNCRSG
ncbi:hypothetical protein EAY16_25365, partial [Vibrio anguillarum]|nr:hypothetical protein [Vibrio anguillarum]